MKCRTARESVAAAERPGQVPADVRAHLDACPDCRAAADRDAVAREWMSFKRNEIAPSDMAARVETGVRAAIAGIRPWPAWRVWAVDAAARPAMRWAAAAVVLLAAGLLWPEAVRNPARPGVARVAPTEFSNAMPEVWGGFPGGFLVLAPLRTTNAWGEEILVQPSGRIEYGGGGTRAVRWDY